jgi:hypothetical protein
MRRAGGPHQAAKHLGSVVDQSVIIVGVAAALDDGGVGAW